MGINATIVLRTVNDVLGFCMLLSNDLAVFALAAVLLHNSGITLMVIYKYMFPAIGLSIVLGCMCSSVEAFRRFRKYGIVVAAMPFGLNMPDVVNFSVMISKLTPSVGEELSWRVSCAANFWSSIVICVVGVILMLASRGVASVSSASRATSLVNSIIPPVAQGTTLAGIALSLISTANFADGFALFFLSVVPLILMLILGIYVKRMEYWMQRGGNMAALPWRYKLHGVYVLLMIAGVTGVAWIGYSLGWDTGVHNEALLPPPLVEGFPMTILNIFAEDVWPNLFAYMGIWIPLAMAGIVGAINNVTTTKPANCQPDVSWALVWSGLASAGMAVCGSPFPCTLYIGQPAFAAAGAGFGYSVINAVVIFALTWSASLGYIVYSVPLAALTPILVLIGVDITSNILSDAIAKPDSSELLAERDDSASEALSVSGSLPLIESVPTEVKSEFWQNQRLAYLFPAVVIGLLPAIATYGLNLITIARSFDAALAKTFSGLIYVSQGFVLLSILWCSMFVHITDAVEQLPALSGWSRAPSTSSGGRSALKAVGYAVALAAFSASGLIHTFEVDSSGAIIPALPGSVGYWPAGPFFAFGYLFIAGTLLFLYWANRRSSKMSE